MAIVWLLAGIWRIVANIPLNKEVAIMTSALMPRKKKETTKSTYLIDSDMKAEIVRTASEDDRNETQQLHYLVKLGLRYRSQMLKTPVDVPVIQAED